MLFRTLKNAQYRNYFFADIVAAFGAGMGFIGANWFVLEKTGTNKAVGILLMVSLISGLAVFPFAGTITDRFNRRTVLAISNITRSVFVALVAVTLFTDCFRISYIYILAVVGGIGWTIFIPASRGLVQEILTPEEYVNGCSLMEISLQVGIFSAAAIAGIIYKYFGYSTILVINALTYVLSVFFLFRIKHKSIVAHDKSQSFYEQFANGARFLVKNPVIFWFGIIMFIPFVATMTANVVLPGYVKDHLHADSVVFGFADMAYGVGACLSGFVAASFAKKMKRFPTLVIFFVISTAALFYLTANTLIAGLYIANFLFGLGNSSLRIIMGSETMELVPKEYMGRSQSVWLFISTLMQILSAYGVGILMDIVPTPFGFLWMGITMIIGLISILLIAPYIYFNKGKGDVPPTL